MMERDMDSNRNNQMSDMNVSNMNVDVKTPAMSAPEAKNGERKKAWSEKAYSFAVDDLLYLWTNSAISVWFTFLVTEKMKPQWEASCKWLGDALKKTVPAWKNHAHPEKLGEVGMGVFILSVPGWLLLAPLKKFEWNQLNVMKWLDKKHDAMTPPSEEDLKLREVAYKEVAEKEKPGWGRIIASRALGWGIFTFASMNIFDMFHSSVLNKQLGLTTKHGISDWVHAAVTPVSRNIYKGVEEQALKTKKWHIVMWITGLELISCFLSSRGVRFFLDFFGSRAEKARKDDALLAGSGAEDALVAAAGARAAAPQPVTSVATHHDAAVTEQAAISGETVAPLPGKHAAQLQKTEQPAPQQSASHISRILNASAASPQPAI